MPRLTFPSKEQIDIALLWLRVNEGDGEEAAACEAVAAWIEAMEVERFLRNEARKCGVTVARLRRKLAEIQAA